MAEDVVLVIGFASLTEYDSDIDQVSPNYFNNSSQISFAFQSNMHPLIPRFGPLSPYLTVDSFGQSLIMSSKLLEYYFVDGSDYPIDSVLISPSQGVRTVSMLLSDILKHPIDRLRVFVPPSPLDIVHAQYPMDMICIMSFKFFPTFLPHRSILSTPSFLFIQLED